MADQGYMIVDGVLADNIAEITAYIDQLNESETLSQLAAELRSVTDDAHRQELYFTLAEDSVSLLKAPLSELEPAYNLLLYVLSTAPDFGALMPVILANLTSELPSGQAQQGVILAVLGNLFNIIPRQSAQKADVFSKIVDFAKASDTMPQLVPQLPELAKWLEEWECDADTKTELATKVYNAVAEASPQPSFNFLLEAVRRLPDHAGLAETLALAALTNTFTYEFSDILALPGVRSHSDLASVLELVAKGDLKAFASSSHASNPKIAHKVRIEALVRLASTSRVLSFDDISAATGESDVEKLVIDACKTPLLKGRMNQFTREFTVESVAAVGDFGDEHWQAIDDRLNAWKRSLLAVQEVFRNSQSDAERVSEFNQLVKA